MFEVPGDVMYQLNKRAENLKVYYEIFAQDDPENHISLLPWEGCNETMLMNLMGENFYNVRFYNDKIENDNFVNNTIHKIINDKRSMVIEYMKDIKTLNTRSSTFGFLFINYFKYNNMDRDSIMDIITRLKKFYKHTFVTLEDFKIWVNLNNNIDESDIMLMENNVLFLMYDIMQVVEISKNMVDMKETSLTAEEVIKIKRRRSFDVEETKKLYRLHNYFNKRINPEDPTSEWQDMIYEFIMNTNPILDKNLAEEDSLTINDMKIQRSNSNYNTENGKEFEHEEFEDDWVRL